MSLSVFVQFFLSSFICDYSFVWFNNCFENGCLPPSCLDLPGSAYLLTYLTRKTIKLVKIVTLFICLIALERNSHIRARLLKSLAKSAVFQITMPRPNLTFERGMKMKVAVADKPVSYFKFLVTEFESFESFSYFPSKLYVAECFTNMH